MEEQSGQGKPQLDFTPLRPPGLEMARGLLYFTLVFLTFMFAQMAALIWRVMALTPTLGKQGFSLNLLETPAFIARSKELGANGDVLAVVTFIADAVCVALLLFVVYRWKRGRTAYFLALGLPSLRSFLTWTGFFIILFAALEGISLLFPDMNSDFMTKVIASVTNYPMMFLGLCIMPAILEEFLLRGLLYGSLRHLLDKHVCVAIVAGIFTLMHQQYEWRILLLNVLPLAVFLGYARANTGSIWTGVFLHLLNNCASMVLPQGH